MEQNIELENNFFFHVQFHITSACNLNCTHCYEGSEKKHIHWGLNEFKDAIESLWSCFRKWGVKGEISLIGGEPTLHPQFEDMVRYLYSRGDVEHISVLTNGTIVNTKFIQLIKDCECSVQVSIDGIDESMHDSVRGKGNYARLINNLKILAQHDIFPSVHYVLSKKTTPLTADFFKNLIDGGIRSIAFSRIVPIGNASINEMLSPEETKDTYDFINEQKLYYQNKGLRIPTTRPLWCNFGYSGRCPVGVQTITILENGDIMPCRRLPIVIGNIKTDNFYKVWYTSPVLNDLRDRSKIEKCGSCELLEHCGGARCISYAVNNNYFKPDPQCWK